MSDHEKRVKLWYTSGDVVKEVECLPRAGDSFWIPKVGSTCTKGYQLFDTHGEALAEAKKKAREAISKYEKILEKLKKL